MMFVDYFPLSVEYYLQERMGYELQMTYLRDPFFSSLNSVNINTVFMEGVGLQFRQKFYQRDEPFGMLYFGIFS